MGVGVAGGGGVKNTTCAFNFSVVRKGESPPYLFTAITFRLL